MQSVLTVLRDPQPRHLVPSMPQLSKCNDFGPGLHQAQTPPSKPAAIEAAIATAILLNTLKAIIFLF